ncbi:MAG: hypothetical protein WKF71_13685 [Pyrinomonadaceae bacterium]
MTSRSIIFCGSKLKTIIVRLFQSDEIGSDAPHFIFRDVERLKMKAILREKVDALLSHNITNSTTYFFVFRLIELSKWSRT